MAATATLSSASTYSSHRHSPSVSSTISSRTTTRSTRPQVESTVTKLLVSIKELLESLTRWSQLVYDENQVSDVYVKLGNDFNAAVAAFTSYNIDMSELLSVPEDLRNILETCLAEDPNEANLNQYLPQVRAIITNLLQGLRTKQHMYRRVVSEQKGRQDSSEYISERSNSRSSRSDEPKARISRSGRYSSSTRSHNSRRSIDQSRNTTLNSLPEDIQLDDNPSSSPRQANGQRRTGQEDAHWVGGFKPSSGQTSDHTDSPVKRHFPERDSLEQSAAVANSYLSEDQQDAAADAPLTAEMSPETNLDPKPPAVPPEVKRYSLVDRPLASSSQPAIVVDSASPEQHTQDEAPLMTPVLDGSQAPAVESSLAALKKSEALERRASKRFSTYTLNKMTGGRDKGSSTSSNRKSMAAGSNLTSGELAVLAEVDESAETPSPTPPRARRQNSRNKGNESSRSRRPSPISENEAPPVPPLPAAENVVSQSVPKDTSARSSRAPPVESADVSSESLDTFEVFLQVNRQIKKVTIEKDGLSFSSLRVLFVDKFSYSPGHEDFPAIYIRDPSSGVEYELEDVDEIKPRCLLSLNIEPLDQVKQHIDQQMSALLQEMKDLKSSFSSSRRASHPLITIPPPSTHSQSTLQARPTDQQFHHVARRLSRLVSDDGEKKSPGPSPTRSHTPLAPQVTGGSMMSEASSSRIVSDLKTQFDEVQNLRRDLGAMRQVYTEFIGQTKETISSLRTQTQNVRTIANTSIGGTRASIVAGKATLDSRSQNVLTRVEELQDLIDNVRDDVLKRHITPRAAVIKSLKNDLDSTAEELKSLDGFISTVRPMWKKTWAEELHNIVEEQGFLKHQEGLISDLIEDHKAVTEIFGHVEKVISIRSSGGSGRGRQFRPPPPDEGHEGLSTVMLEIRGAAVDPERRLKAIAANERNRERELASRSNEFQNELDSFVSGKKLKLTGGAEEAERLRQKRNDMTLKAMFNGGASEPAPATPGSSGFGSPLGSPFESS